MTPIERELNFEGPSPILYLVSTPIGNLKEASPRMIEVVSSCDYVACEDTRNSGKLLSLLGLSKPLISCHEHNEEAASDKVVALLKEGKQVCYMSDAGYPAISDPGARLVARCLKEGIKVSVTSGPSAAINALVCSGLDSTHFYFAGFLPPKENEKTAELNDLAKRSETLIFYEAPHRIIRTLISMAATLGDRKAVIARELTKAHEEFVRGSLSELALLDEETLKGEMVIVVEGAKTQKEEMSDSEIAHALKQELDWGKSPKEAIAATAKNNGLPKNRVYAVYLQAFAD